MTQEEFGKTLSLYLDVLSSASNENKNKLLIYGSGDKDDSPYFFIREREPSTYNIEFGVGDYPMIGIEGISHDQVLDMFYEEVFNSTCKFYISTDF